jgi:hypothetical protein
MITERRTHQEVFGILLLSGFLMAGVGATGAQSDKESSRPAQQQAGAASQETDTEKAQKEESPPAEQPVEAEAAELRDEKSSKTYPITNGTLTFGRTEESEKKKTADGEIERHRIRMPTYGGDQRVLLERETRTKKLPDGTIEKEHVLKNPDGSNRMVPIEIIREKIKPDGDSTIIEREVLKQDYAGRWQPTRKERVTQSGPEESRQSLKEVRELNLAGDWIVVDREVTTESSSEGQKQSRSVRQLPDASGRLADYEVREERTAREGEKETTEVSVRRRDSQDTHQPKFILVERTRAEQAKSEDGRVTKTSTTESDLVAGGASRNITPGAPKVVEEKSEVETPGPDGASRRTVTVKERGAVNREMRSSSQIVQETDSKGNVRQIFIPSR